MTPSNNHRLPHPCSHKFPYMHATHMYVKTKKGGNLYDVNDIFRDWRSLAFCLFSWLPHGSSSWRLCSSHVPLSHLLNLTSTALVPHSGPGFLTACASPLHQPLGCLSPYIIISPRTAFLDTSENNSSLESDQRLSEQLNVITQNYTDLNPGTLLCLSLRKLKAFIYWPRLWGHHGSPQREKGMTSGCSVQEPKSLLL